MSMIAPIPEKMREEMAGDPFYKKCCLADENCSGRIEWHHSETFAGKRLQEKWCILPLCQWHHIREAQFRDRLRWIAVNRASDMELVRISKAENFIDIRMRLNKIYDKQN